MPAPDDEDFDRLRRRVLWSMPSGLYVIGAGDGTRFNAMTLNLATQVSMEPKRVGIAVTKHAFTHELIEAAQAFSINLIGRDDRAVVRKFVKPVEVDLEAKTLNGFGYHLEASGSPVLDIAYAYVDCRLHQAVDAGDHTFFIGDVIGAAFGSEEHGDVLRMEDTRMNYGG